MHRFSPLRVAKIPLANWLATGALALVAMPAHAVYTIIDDDLLPDSVIAARDTQSVASTADHYAVAFPKLQTALGPMGMTALDMLLPNMKGGTIRIVGRPDAMPFTANDKQVSLPRYRAINIRNYLVRKGIPESSITVEVDNSPNPQPNGSNYPSDIFVNRAQTRPAVALSAPRYADTLDPQEVIISALRPVVSAPVVARPGASAITLPVNDQLVKYINMAVQSGQMSPEVAVQLLRTILASNGGVNTPQQPVQAPVQAITPTVRWVLDKKLTLKDNIDAWAKSAGWNPTVWQASNLFQVTTTTTLDGGFPDVLRKVADSTGLNICAKQREKYVRVTDANVACN